MTNQHPITLPSDDMVQQWRDTWAGKKFCCEMDEYIAFRAALWGADQELEACCEWVSKYSPYFGDYPMPEDKLRAARRPRTPSLKEQALAALNVIEDKMLGPTTEEKLIRKALEALPND